MFSYLRFECFLKPVNKVIDVCLGQNQRRKDTQDVGSRSTGEAMLIIDEFLAHLALRQIHFNADHQAATTDILDVRFLLPEFLELVDEIGADGVGILYQM